MYWMLFPKKYSYVDAHSFYDEHIYKKLISVYSPQRNIIVVTKQETIERLHGRIGAQQINIPATEIYAMELYEPLKQSIESAINTLPNNHVTILFALGPVGKLLADEFAQRGIQCIDVGKGLEKYSTKSYG